MYNVPEGVRSEDFDDPDSDCVDNSLFINQQKTFIKNEFLKQLNLNIFIHMVKEKNDNIFFYFYVGEFLFSCDGVCIFLVADDGQRVEIGNIIELDKIKEFE